MLTPSPKKKAPTLLTCQIGVVHAPVECFAEAGAVPVRIDGLSNSSCSNGSENERLGNLLNRKIQRRLRKQRGIHKIDHELGDMMRLFRSNAGITLADMAYKTNLPFIHLHDIEQGKRSASISELHKIFSIYEIPIAQIASQLKR